MITSYNFENSINEVFAIHSINIIIGLIGLACWYINATAINDLADFEIDKINLQKETDRPLINGYAGKRLLKFIAIFSLFVGSSSMLLVSWRAMLLFLILIFFNYIYSMPPIRISYRGGLAQLLLPIGYVILPYCFGVLVINKRHLVIAPIVLLGLYLIFCSRVLLKDFRDVKGDKKYGKKTFLLRHTIETVATASASIYILGIGCLSIFLIRNTSLAWMITPLLFLVGVNLAFFSELSKTSKWSQQKPLLPSIGRLITAQIIILILTLLIRAESINILISITMAVCITAMFFISAVRNYQFLLSRS